MISNIKVNWCDIDDSPDSPVSQASSPPPPPPPPATLLPAKKKCQY